MYQVWKNFCFVSWYVCCMLMMCSYSYNYQEFPCPAATIWKKLRRLILHHSCY